MMITPVTHPPLTPRQKEIYQFLRDKILNRGYGPTVREIGLQFDIKSPNGVMCHLKALEKKGLITRESHLSRAIQLTESHQDRTSLPLAGQIAAGSPVLAIEDSERMDFADFFQGSDHVCLKVEGDSMVEDHISEGDFVIVKKQNHCGNGEIVVAMVDGEGATLKRYFQEPNRIRLEPANSKMKPTYPKSVDVLGVVVGVIRRC